MKGICNQQSASRAKSGTSLFHVFRKSLSNKSKRVQDGSSVTEIFFGGKVGWGGGGGAAHSKIPSKTEKKQIDKPQLPSTST